MILKFASAKAVRFACLKFHYAKAVPSVSVAYSVFNAKNDWCGIIAFGPGANKNLYKQYDMPAGTLIELVRVALNGKQESTGKALSIALKLMQKHCPMLSGVISYADPLQNHVGVLYQATNWLYLGAKGNQTVYEYKGRYLHGRTAVDMFGTAVGLPKKHVPAKHKYVYVLKPEFHKKVKHLAKPYPKPACEAFTDDATGKPAREGVRFDPHAPKNDVTEAKQR